MSVGYISCLARVDGRRQLDLGRLKGPKASPERYLSMSMEGEKIHKQSEPYKPDSLPGAESLGAWSPWNHDNGNDVIERNHNGHKGHLE